MYLTTRYISYESSLLAGRLSSTDDSILGQIFRMKVKMLPPRRFPMHDVQTITAPTHKNIPSKIENKRQSVKIEDPRSVADDPIGETDCSTHGIDNNLLYCQY